MKDYFNTTVIIPTLNEAQNIGSLAETIFKLYPKIKIIVSDDGSSDKTQEIVSDMSKEGKAIKLLDRAQMKVHGLTASVLDAIKIVDTSFFVVIDADLQHPPEKIDEMVSFLRDESADVVVGFREKVVGDWPVHRKMLSKFGLFLGSAYLKIRGKKSCRDVLSGFFAAKASFVKEEIEKYYNRFELRGYKVLFDLLKFVSKEIKIMEVPYSFNERERGESKIGIKHLFYYFRSFFN
ncbi:hypothetical protein A2230_07850 [candidate division WOR-1 bacterium RIFOXYA2_FULL_36_21]|uniref:Glycosyltransferase 2-like domain-containing protein n=1 Tax=candidate division WOR-1 bacterium RIFOXYB2_FULL_36_35 TaxID=1802578 RepID=A0A1F4RYX3_UNCSA|nr:MAG: hypothetical protein A2230_07850 [candidate division WOR-1 bacterium RIFOXYA2_FULL_36_21]OGC13361.1 MAG: hypothetical protein A2290_02530 [candidate division WOR-1 bacterium RIFOXYB2_FULL_36_35]OGC16596.1 MAG: hypothetical protein A2282_09320 [candidate division WOR-1 bacterium RIFOXYA12_FULL_36_13]